MLSPPTLADESQRVAALEALNILYSPADERFDRITRITQRLFDVPIALISLVSSEKQWFKSNQGLTVSETDREISFCGHAIKSDDTFVITNALKDPDFSDNPLVVGDPKIRFYAGQPIHSGGKRIGTLCIIDSKPRHLRPKDYDSLRALASWAETELKVHSDNSPSHIRTLIEMEDRRLLLDAATGCINELGLASILDNFEKENGQSEPIPLIELSISNIHADLSEAELPLRLKDCAQTLRAELGDRASLAIKDNYNFVIIPAEPSAKAVKTIQGHIAHTLEQSIPAVATQDFQPEFSIKVHHNPTQEPN